MIRLLLHPRRGTHPVRTGAAHILIAVMLFAFVVTAALTVDFAYMQLIRTELRTATDAAAKAGAEALARTQDSSSAVAAAVQYANLNRVAGRPFQIRDSDVTLGRVTGQNNGTWTFVPEQQPYNSVRVNARIADNAVYGSVPTFFGPAFGHSGFTTSQQATAGQQEVEVVLCLDRSRSMCWDMSGRDEAYPSGNPYPPLVTNHGNTWKTYTRPPHPSASRWAVLNTAVNSFLTEAGNFQYPPRTSLVTWGSDYTLPFSPRTRWNSVDTDVALPDAGHFTWSTNMSAVQTAMNWRSTNAMMGSTTLSDGLDRAVEVLTGPTSRALSNKIILLMTDGEWNAGRDPVLSAQDAANAGITVHVVSMLTSTQATLTNIASITGGKYYATQNTAQLQAAFQEIARSLPIVLTD